MTRQHYEKPAHCAGFSLKQLAIAFQRIADSLLGFLWTTSLQWRQAGDHCIEFLHVEVFDQRNAGTQQFAFLDRDAGFQESLFHIAQHLIFDFRHREAITYQLGFFAFYFRNRLGQYWRSWFGCWLGYRLHGRFRRRLACLGDALACCRFGCWLRCSFLCRRFGRCWFNCDFFRRRFGRRLGSCFSYSFFGCWRFAGNYFFCCCFFCRGFLGYWRFFCCSCFFRWRCFFCWRGYRCFRFYFDLHFCFVRHKLLLDY